MKIDMNKDFEQEFKGSFWKGLAGREVFWAALALLVSSVVVVTIWHFTNIPINVCVYFGLPVMAPIAAIGIVKFQGATIGERINDLQYFRYTQELGYDAEEYQENRRIFTMSNQKKGRK